MSHRGRWLAGACVSTAAAILVATGGTLATPPHETSGSGAADEVAVGAYLHYGSPGVTRMQELSRWLGGTELRAGHTYLPGDTWSSIEGAPDSLRSWARWRGERADRLFVLNVPMLAGNEARVPDSRVAELLRSGARGAYDHHFNRLAKRLVGLEVPDTVIVLGWEMNGFDYTHRCRPDPESWKRYWRRIVSAMRSVKGQRFRFDFAPNRGGDAIAWTTCYPGDDVVDVVGMDSYDQPPGETFDDYVTQPYGLRHQVDFARAHGKRISYPEWGLFRNGDNPDYMGNMLAWIAEHKPLYHSITDYCPHGVWQCGQNPRSAQVFRDFLSARHDRGLPSVFDRGGSGTVGHRGIAYGAAQLPDGYVVPGRRSQNLRRRHRRPHRRVSP
ncbi:glycosyl hydrolase [Streptomyces sp. G-G2]|uniref:glycosyl hydrolase n=1 Tax=Streptomyces sp. G-G2 TaxID=3046201 RepID=UPI0024B8E32D|nr:glycosyl hydrolase [Streptomyces sp. G-G2]MDJ0382374.1 glycosyl hydrolase [Streptomyces sp. G-G2]